MLLEILIKLNVVKLVVPSNEIKHNMAQNCYTSCKIYWENDDEQRNDWETFLALL